MAASLLICLLVAVVIAVTCLRFYLRRTVYCPVVDRLDDRTVLITGASSGIGREVALECARRGARLLLGCRNANKAEAVVAYIKRKTGNDDIHYVVVDLACLTSVRQLVEVCCRRQWTVDVLINNAAYLGPKKTSEDGYDLCFQVNFLSHFYLSNLIIQRQTDARTSTFADDEGEGRRSRSLRVINVASNAYSRGSMTRLFQMTSRPETGNDKDGTESVYNIYEAYADSKLAMMLFSTELNFRHTVNNVLCLATHPGPVRSGLQSHWPGLIGRLLRLSAWLFFREPVQGAQTVVYCAVVSDSTVLDQLCGKLVVDCRGVDVLQAARKYRDAERLWAVASQMCGLSDASCTMATEPLAAVATAD